MAKSKLFLSLDDAVEVVAKRLDCNNSKEIIKQELEQKCYISTTDYEIGYRDALEEISKAINVLSEVSFEKWLEVKLYAN